MTYRSRRPRTDAESARLPAIVRIFLWAFVSRRDQRSVQSDLAELYMARRNRDGAPRARRWLMRHIAQYPLRIIAERLHRVGDAVSAPFLQRTDCPRTRGANWSRDSTCCRLHRTPPPGGQGPSHLTHGRPCGKGDRSRAALLRADPARLTAPQRVPPDTRWAVGRIRNDSG